MRKRAKENKVRRVKGLPPLPLDASEGASEGVQQGGGRRGVEEEEPATLPLRTNADRSYQWLLRAARADHPDAQVALGNAMMSREPFDPANVTEALSWYTLASATQPDALYNLGMAHWEGVEGALPADAVKAVEYFEQAAALFDTSALFWLGSLYHTGDEGRGIRPNFRKALRYLELAAGSGHGGAAHYLAAVWRTGDDKLGVKADEKKTRYFLEEAAAADHADALFELGDAHYHGRDGYPVSLVAALKYYERAAASGHAGALLSAGAMHYHGHGTKQDHEAAFGRYQAAADMGNMQAWRNIAAMYAAGEGVPASVPTAKAILAMVQRQEAGAKATQ